MTNFNPNPNFSLPDPNLFGDKTASNPSPSLNLPPTPNLSLCSRSNCLSFFQHFVIFVGKTAFNPNPNLNLSLPNSNLTLCSRSHGKKKAM